MTTRQRLWLAIFVVAILACGALALHRLTASVDGVGAQAPDADAHRPPAGTDQRGHSRAPHSAVATASSPARSVPAQPLPAPDTPLLSMHGDLLDRLAGGDARAGCRLYREIQRCWHHAQHAQAADAVMDHAISRELEDAPTRDAAGFIARLEDKLEHSRNVCEGVGAEQFDAYFDVVRRTAELGDPLAMVEFAENGGFLAMEYVRHPDRLATWHSKAPEMIERALRLGTPEAAFSLYMARRHEVGLLGALLPDDPVEAQAMSLLLGKVLAARWNPPPLLLSPQQAQQAEERANDLYRQHFSHRRAPPALRVLRDPLQPRIEDCEHAG